MKMPNRDQWSVRADGVRPASAGPESVIVVPDDCDLGVGYAMVRELLDDTQPGTTIRLIGADVTDLNRCPEWLRSHSLARSVILTELDAYLPLEREAWLRSFSTWADEWLGHVFYKAFDGIDAARAFRSTLSNRVLLKSLTAQMLMDGVLYHHAQDRLTSPDSRWAKCLSSKQVGTRVEAVVFGLKLVLLLALNAPAALGLRSREYLAESTSRCALRSFKAKSRAGVSCWIGVIGSWPYASRHAIECVKGEPFAGEFGVLLEDSLRTGAQHSHRAQITIADAVFPTLNDPAIRDRYGAIGQCVSAMSVRQLLAAFIASFSTMLTATFRAVKWGPKLGLLRLDNSLGGLARVLSIDVLRATEAAHATRRLTREHPFAGVTAVLPHASAPSVAVADLLMQREGATTVELVHGAFADRQGVATYAFSASTVRATWTEVEARMLEPHLRGQRCVGGFVPRRPAVKRAARDKVSTILALTNYGVGIVGSPAMSYVRLAYCQRAFFEAVDEAVSATGRKFSVRWRPHPADDPDSLQSVLANHKSLQLEVSQGKCTLEDDLEAADVVISSWSSALVEALRHPVPVFIHAVPYYESDGTLAAFSPQRRFSTQGDLTAPLSAAIEALERNAEEALEPERQLRQAFFGPTEQAKPAEMAFRIKEFLK